MILIFIFSTLFFLSVCQPESSLQSRSFVLCSHALPVLPFISDSVKSILAVELQPQMVNGRCYTLYKTLSDRP